MLFVTPQLSQCVACTTQNKPLVLNNACLLAGLPSTFDRSRGQIARRRRAVNLGRHALLGLLAIHDMGVYHGDFKSSNMVVSEKHGDGTAQETLKLIGMGFARELQAGCKLQPHEAGTPAYLAPETRRRAQAGPASDVYAFWAADVGARQ